MRQRSALSASFSAAGLAVGLDQPAAARLRTSERGGPLTVAHTPLTGYTGSLNTEGAGIDLCGKQGISAVFKCPDDQFLAWKKTHF